MQKDEKNRPECSLSAVEPVPILCKVCGKDVSKCGFYNTPHGIHCSACWERVPEKVKDKALQETLGVLASRSRPIALRKAKPGKRLWVFLYPFQRFVVDATDDKIISDYETYRGKGVKVQKCTPEQLADLINTDSFGYDAFYVRFIKC